MSVLIASDLDQTLIYSERSGRFDSLSAATCVEIYDGREQSFMLTSAAEALTALSLCATIIPVTTRTVAQLGRVRLPTAAGRYAIAANGGTLLVDGEPDTSWAAQVAAGLRDSAPVTAVQEYLGRVCDPAWALSVRTADGLFCYAVVDLERLPSGFLDEAREWALAHGWRVSKQGRKIYWVPQTLTKAAAAAEVARRTDAELLLAAGDSFLDQDLLEHADLAIMPGHGELFESGWRPSHVTSTAGVSGAAAGAEIVDWFARQTAAHEALRGDRAL